MSVIGAILLCGFFLYLAAGVVVAIAFVSKGVTEVQHAPVTIPARILFIPASTMLWPLVLRRWMRARARP